MEKELVVNLSNYDDKIIMQDSTGHWVAYGFNETIKIESNKINGTQGGK